RLDAGHPRHGDVEDGQIDVVVHRAPHRLGAVTDLGHDPHVRLGLEHEPQAAAHDGVVVGQEDADPPRRDGHLYASTAADGMQSSTSTPPSSLTPSTSRPPIM